MSAEDVIYWIFLGGMAVLGWKAGGADSWKDAGILGLAVIAWIAVWIAATLICRAVV